jgi:NADPH:quinone reductase-like Zn-dependent oxidoreductase
MKSYHAEPGGGLASLVARSHPVPQPGSREVLVRVRANSLNAIGGGTLERSIQSVALDGQLNSIGRLSRESTTIDMDILYRSAATVRVVFAGHRAHFAAMNRAIAVNHLRPIIDRAFPFEDVLGAFRYYESGQMFGKVVISLTQEAR